MAFDSEKLEYIRRIRDDMLSKDLERICNIKGFCLFVGQSRSGHSVMGTLLNAHRNVVMSHNLDILAYFRAGASREELLLLILEHDRWLDDRNRKIGGYSYQIDNAWLGYHEEILLIGDKRAGAAARHLAEDPELILRLQSELELPISIIHHVRNPWDNISSIWSRKTLGKSRTLEQAANHYFEMLDGVVAVKDATEGRGIQWLSSFHEDLINHPSDVMTTLFDQLDLTLPPGFLETCEGFIHPVTSQSRFNADWSPGLVKDIALLAARYNFLDRYTFNGA